MQQINVMARTIFLAGLIFISNILFAQVREIPEAVKETFTSQYPGAENVTYEDNLVSVQVHFKLNGENMVAAYNNKGRWKDTEKNWSFDQLPEAVKDGFQKSKYADWKVTEVKMIFRPGGSDRYRIKAEKNDIQKKHIFFNKAGRLVDDSITL
jgi:NDP-sugar pyrophosphorylase family protein